jgi:acid phosphatase
MSWNYILVVGLLVALYQCAPFPYCDPFQAKEFPPLSPAPPQVGNLKLLQVLVRHGARTPVVGLCPKDDAIWTCDTMTNAEKPSKAPGKGLYIKSWIPKRQFYPGNCGRGVLTEVGYDQHIRNGQYFRKTYGGFLPDRVNRETFESKFYVRSTNVPRTILSAESLLTGLYPPEKRDEEFNIYINTIDETNENLFENQLICPKVGVYSDAFRKSQLYVNHSNTMTNPLIKKIAKILKVSETEAFLPALFDCWIADICHGFPVPPGINETVLNQVMKEGEWLYSNNFNYPSRLEYSKVGIGLFFKDYLDVFQNVRTDPNNTLSFVLYSAHDTTIMPILNALNIWDGLWPTFASFIVTEYYEGPTPQIRITYNGKPLKIPQCGGSEFCPYQTFENLVKNLIPTAQDCQVNSPIDREMHFGEHFN